MHAVLLGHIEILIKQAVFDYNPADNEGHKLKNVLVQCKSDGIPMAIYTNKFSKIMWAIKQIYPNIDDKVIRCIIKHSDHFCGTKFLKSLNKKSDDNQLRSIKLIVKVLHKRDYSAAFEQISEMANEFNFIFDALIARYTDKANKLQPRLSLEDL